LIDTGGFGASSSRLGPRQVPAPCRVRAGGLFRHGVFHGRLAAMCASWMLSSWRTGSRARL